MDFINKSDPNAVGVVAYTDHALAANEVWDSGIMLSFNTAIHFSLQTDVVGTYEVEYYLHGTKVNFSGQPTTFDPAVVSAFQGALSSKGDSFKLIYRNGPVAQTTFYLEIRYSLNIQQTYRSIAAPMSGTNMGGTTHATIEGRENGTGNYKQLTITTNGAKNALDVNIVGNGNQTAATDVSALAKDITLTNGTQKTQITNKDTDYAKEAGNLLAILNKLSSDPATAAGLTAILNKLGTTLNVSVTNQPATQPVSGSIAVSNFPTTQPVSGTVNVANFPSSENVVVTNFPVTQVPPTVGAKQVLNIAANGNVTIAASTTRKGVVIASNSGTLFIALGFTATATDWTYRIVTNGIVEIPELWSGVSISIFASSASTGTATLLT